MKSLAEMKFVPIQGDESRISKEEMGELKSMIPKWEIVKLDGEDRLQRVFEFDNFAQALGFTNQVGSLAEEQDHHPRLVTEWGRVTATWWTHKIGGLHQNDFIMASKTEQLYEAE